MVIFHHFCSSLTGTTPNRLFFWTGTIRPEQNGKSVAIPINISNQNDTYAAVTGEGLNVGSEIVIDGQNVLQADEKVRKVQ